MVEIRLSRLAFRKSRVRRRSFFLQHVFHHGVLYEPQVTERVMGGWCAGFAPKKRSYPKSIDPVKKHEYNPF